MPKHIHGIIQIVGAPLAGARGDNAVVWVNRMAPMERASARGAPAAGVSIERILVLIMVVSVVRRLFGLGFFDADFL